MMNYEEAAAEIRRRRDAEIKQRKTRQKKLAAVLCSVIVFASVGTGAWMMSRREAAVTPDVKETDVTSSAETETQTIQTGIANPNQGNTATDSDGGFWSENRLDIPAHYIIKGDGDIPAELMTYTVDNGDRYLIDNNYEAGVDKEYYVGSMANLREYVVLLYGEENIDDERFGIHTYNTDDPNIYAVVETGARPIRGWADHIRVQIDADNVAADSILTSDAAYEYLASTKYFETALEFLEIKNLWTTLSVSGRGRETTYRFTVSESNSDCFAALAERDQRYIELIMCVRDGNVIDAIIDIYDKYDLVEHALYKTVPYEEGLAGTILRLNERYKQYPDETMEVIASVKYSSAVTEAGDSVIVPYFVFYFGERNENGDFIWEYKSDFPMVEGVDFPY